MQSKSKRLFLYLFSFLLISVISFILFSGKAYAGNCDTGNGSRINFGSSGNFVCDGESFVFDPWRTEQRGLPTFVNKNATQIIIIGHVDGSQEITGARVYDNGQFGVVPIETRDPAKYDAIAVDANQNNRQICSMKLTTDCFVASGWGFPAEKYAGPMPAATTTKINDIIEELKTLAGQTSLNAALDEACESRAGALGFLLCPLYNSIVESITTITGQQKIGEVNDGILVKLLIVKPLDASSNTALRDGVQKVVAIANTLYILLFLVIIFANVTSFGLDNYTVKKALPRLIIAIILTQFSFLICTLAIDLGNILGYYIPALFGTITSGNTIRDGLAFLFLLGNGTGLQTILTGGAFIISLLMAVVILIVLLVAVVFMITRILILYVLVLLSPLAFAAMVLPGTQSLFKKWATNFVKLILVFPLVTGLIAVAGVVSSLLIQSSSNWSPTAQVDWTQFQVNITDPILFLAGCLMPAIALCFIPKMFKLSGDIAAKTGGLAAGYITGKAAAGGKGIARGAGKSAKEGATNLKTAGQTKLAGTSFGQRTGTGSWLAGTGFTNSRRNQQARAAKLAEIQKEAEEDVANRTANMTRDQLREDSSANLESLGKMGGKAFTDTRATGHAKAYVDKLIKTGDSAGVARAYHSYATNAKAAGLSDDEIGNYWNSAILGANFGDAKGMSPSLIGTPETVAAMTAPGSDHLTMKSYVNPAGETKTYLHQTEGNFSALGEDKLSQMDADMLKGVVASIDHGGADVNRFQFDKTSVQKALSDPNTQWANAEARAALQDIANKKGW